MKEVFILDACSLIAFLCNEHGSKDVEAILRKSFKNEYVVYMASINLLEVYYDVYRNDGKDRADQVYDDIIKLPIIFLEKLDEIIVKEAGRFKATYKISLADSIVLAYGKMNHAKIITADHHEFDVIDKNGEGDFHWFR